MADKQIADHPQLTRAFWLCAIMTGISATRKPLRSQLRLFSVWARVILMPCTRLLAASPCF